jgi:hypothetical protein
MIAGVAVCQMCEETFGTDQSDFTFSCVTEFSGQTSYALPISKEGYMKRRTLFVR